MKYIVLLGDGMAGRPLEELNGRTTLESANKPVMDRLSAVSELGLARMVPEGMAPGSDTANLSVMGYDPLVYYTGRSPLEALSIGVDLKDTDISFRCNVVTISEHEGGYEDQEMIDHSAGEITTEEARELIHFLAEKMLVEGYALYPGVSYRHLLVQEDGELKELTPPHDIPGKPVREYLPSDLTLRDMMIRSFDLLKDHPINVRRKAEGKRPANSAWFWGAGSKPMLSSFEKERGKKGVMVSAVDLLKGIAIGAGLKAVDVEGANGGLYTNYAGKVQAVLDALNKDGFDFAYIHVEAPDEMSHQGNIEDKIKAIEYLDEKVLKPILEGMDQSGEDYRILICPDHYTPIEVRTHTGEMIPYILYDSTKKVSGADSYNEKTAEASGNVWPEGYKLMAHLLQEDVC